MDLNTIFKNFNTELKVQIAIVLSNDVMTAREIIDEHKALFGGSIRRETVYRALESMIKYGAVEKKYDSESNAVYYKLVIKSFKINFVDRDLKLE